MLNETTNRLNKNNFDLLRLIFAATVCLVHSAKLSGFAELQWIGHVLSSEIAVKAFFVVSGFLIFMSFERSSSLRSYAEKRIRRIYPAYFFVVVLCAFGLFLASSKDPATYFSTTWLRYLIANLAFLNFIQPTLPGVFEANALNAVNGALWTLKIEVMFYISVPLFVYLFRKASPLPVLVATYLISIIYANLMQSLAQKNGNPMFVELARQLPGQLSYFVSGAFFYYFLPLLERHWPKFLLAGIGALAVNLMYPLATIEPFALAAVVVIAALFFPLGDFGKYGDFSYGVYIIHFPLIQLLLTQSQMAEHPWIFLTLVILLTGMGGIMLWHAVEKRFLLKGSHYIAPPQHVPDNSNNTQTGPAARYE